MSGRSGSLSEVLRRAAGQLPYLPRALALVVRAARAWTLAWVGLLVAQGLLPVATVFLTRLLVDGLVAAVGAQGAWESVRPVLWLVAAMAGLMLAAEVLRGLAGWVRTAQAEAVRDHISALIHARSTSVDLSFYEMPDYYDHLHRARDQASYRPLELIESLGGVLQNGITLVAMGAVLIPFGLWLPVALLVSTVPALWVVLAHSIQQHRWRLRATADERRSWYYDWVLTSGENAAELRLFDLGDHFRGLFQSVRNRLRGERVRLARRQGTAELAAGGFGLVVTGAAMAWMAWRTLRSELTLGDLALFFQAFYQGQRLMRVLLESVGQIYSNVLFLGDLFHFLDLEPRLADPATPRPLPSPLRQGVRFSEVTFRYPGSSRPALDRLRLTVPAGRIAAVVGPNGAGKSTLTKLLCRFYDPDEGTITLDGIDLREFAIADLRRAVTVLLQPAVRYNATAAANIAMSAVDVEVDEASIRTAAEAAGADETIGRLPGAYEALLGRWFEGGTELSQGEWQRIALARAFLRRADLILLDEPTGHLDSWAETQWMERFRSIVRGATVLLVTHRFSTAMQADVIHVMRDGAVIESGTHAQLVAARGFYASSWTAQTGERPDRPDP